MGPTGKGKNIPLAGLRRQHPQGGCVSDDTSEDDGIRWKQAIPRLGFIVVEVVFLAITHFFGGPPWAVVGMVALLAQIVAQILAGFRGDAVILVVPSLLWLAFFHTTGNRELFFPYTMYLASGVALRGAERSPSLGILGGGAVVTAFMVIRILQNATSRVLLVELMIAAAILSLPLVVRSWSRTHAIVRDAVIAAVSSLLAYASLAL